MNSTPLLSTPYDPADNNVFDPHLVRAQTHEHTSDPIPTEDFLNQPPSHSNGPERPYITPIQPVKKGGYGLIHESPTDASSILSIPKHYDHHESRKYLLWVGLIRFFGTLFFCILLGLTLRAFEGFNEPRILNKPEIRLFNAITLGLSLGLGFNISSSLKQYASILRWSILTKRYVSLEVFDLILSCESLTDVTKLMVVSIPGVGRFPALSKLPWFREARRDGDRITSIVCFLWLSLNIGAQILVALLSLFWPIDPSTTIPLLAHGDIVVSNLTTWDPNPPILGNGSQLAMANGYGYEAYRSQIVTNLTEIKMQEDRRQTIYAGDGFHEYRFLNRNPDNNANNYLISSRKVRTTVKCEQLEVKEKLVYDRDHHQLANASRDGRDWWYYDVPYSVSGSISWVSSKWSHCGPRCTNFTVYQSSDNGIKDNEIIHPSLFLCNSTVSPVTWDMKEFDNLGPADKAALEGTDAFARIAAGAIGWTGYGAFDMKDRQVRTYLGGMQWSPYHMIKTDEVEDLISLYSIGSIAAFDDHGPKFTLKDQNRLPVQGQQLNVDWSWVFSILAGICVIQFSVVVTLIAFANKSIIRDASYFSVAMLLSPVIQMVGRGGMNLSGDEIKHHANLLGQKIRYDYREGIGGKPNQVDIFFQDRDMKESRRSWVDGDYS